MQAKEKIRLKELKRKIKELQKIIDQKEKEIENIKSDLKYIDLDTRCKKGEKLMEIEIIELEKYYIALQQKCKELANAYQEQTELYFRETNELYKIGTPVAIVSLAFALGALFFAIIKILV